MTDPQLAERARNAGIAPDYWDWQGNHVDVPAETLTAILDVLDKPGVQSGGGAAPAAAEDSQRPEAQLQAQSLKMPEQRQWGFTVQLYSARSHGSWGHGDLRDLAELARWSAAALGAGFVLVNPLHAAEPQPPVSPSPYLPMTRLFTSPLYLRVEDIPEYDALSPGSRHEIAQLAAPLKASNETADLIDRDAVWTAKREALHLVASVPQTTERQAAFERYRKARGEALKHWSAWCALAERHGADYREWPADLRHPDGGERHVAADQELTAAAHFHEWLQWQADEQLQAAQAAAKAAGMAHGIIHDLAVGVHPGGADAWAYQDLLAGGFSVGAPPDEFNQLGQDWAQPPWHPRALAAAHYQPTGELFGATLRHAGGIRIDHVMGLTRLWWIPAGQSADRGAYVSYDHEAAVAALTGAAARAGAIAIGEDLGTVPPWIRDYLAERGVLGTEMLWFAREGDGSPLRPEHWRRTCMATVGTHDVPTIAGFYSGEQVTARATLGLLKTSEERERADLQSMLAAWRAALVERGLLPAEEVPDTARFTVALYGYLRQTPALLVGVSLADAVGELRTQNIPGTSEEYPNWRIPLCDDRGRAVFVEELPDCKLLLDVCSAVRGD